MNANRIKADKCLKIYYEAQLISHRSWIKYLKGEKALKDHYEMCRVMSRKQAVMMNIRSKLIRDELLRDELNHNKDS